MIPPVRFLTQSFTKQKRKPAMSSNNNAFVQVRDQWADKLKGKQLIGELLAADFPKKTRQDQTQCFLCSGAFCDIAKRY